LASLEEYMELAPTLAEWPEIQTLALEFSSAAARLNRSKCSDREFNRAAHGITRLLNPVMYHACSEFVSDIGHFQRLFPGLALAGQSESMGSDEIRMARIALRRQCNRVGKALRSAITVINQVGF